MRATNLKIWFAGGGFTSKGRSTDNRPPREAAKLFRASGSCQPVDRAHVRLALRFHGERPMQGQCHTAGGGKLMLQFPYANAQYGGDVSPLERRKAAYI